MMRIFFKTHLLEHQKSQAVS